MISMAITTVLLAFEYLVTHLVSIMVFKEDLIKKYDELEKYDVDTIITNKEIEDIFNEVMND